jgi:cyanophycin synthetase
LGALVELRVLEGPNLYFPRAAIKLTLDVGALASCSEQDLRRLGAVIGVPVRPGPPHTGFRQRAVVRVLTMLVRRIARDAGTTRLGLRVRATSDPDQVVVAYPWRDRNRARALGEAVAGVVDGLGGSTPVEDLVAAAAAQVSGTERGPGPTTIRPRVPVVAVTGTNGKTTTSRMIAHIAREAGHLVGWSNTDGIYVDGELVEAGDYSGPSGAGRVLEHRIDFAVTETARGGILLRGIGVVSNDVSVVTNVTADHLGLQGIDTLDQLAEVKGVVPRITKKSGWAVLNADDPRVFAMRLTTAARPWVFSRDPDSPALREVLSRGGRATTVLDGWITVLEASGAEPVVLLVDVPMTLNGLSRFNVENALAATSAALAAGISRESVVRGLRSFLPDAEHNPGRMNFFSLPRPDGDLTVVMDLAHNEAGLEAMVEIMRGVRPPGRRILLGLGAVGDRQDELLELLGEIAARDADVVAIGHKEKYLRGRSLEDMDRLFRVGAERVGVSDVETYPTELASLQALVEQAEAGDVVGLMCHAERQEVYDWLADQGATPDGPEELRAKVLVATVD